MWQTMLFRCFPVLLVNGHVHVDDGFPSALVRSPDLLSLNRVMTFGQRYTAVAFLIRVNSMKMVFF